MNLNDPGARRKDDGAEKTNQSGSQIGNQENRPRIPTSNSVGGNGRKRSASGTIESNRERPRDWDYHRSQIQLRIPADSNPPNLPAHMREHRTLEERAGLVPSRQPQFTVNSSGSCCKICDSEKHVAEHCSKLFDDEKLTDRQQGFKRGCPHHETMSHTIDQCEQKWHWLRSEHQVIHWLVLSCCARPAFATDLLDWRCLIDPISERPTPWTPEFARSQKKKDPEFQNRHALVLDPSTGGKSRDKLGYQTFNGEGPKFRQYSDLQIYAEAEYQKEMLRKEDLRVISKYSLESRPMVLARIWPPGLEGPRLEWDLVKYGQSIRMDLHGVAIAVMFLRRMYAFWGGEDYSGGETTLLMQLAWTEKPFSDKTKRETVQALLQVLGIPITESGAPTFTEIIQHDTMVHVWGTPSMFILKRRCRVQREGRAPKVVTAKEEPGTWKKYYLIELNGSETVERVANAFANRTVSLPGPRKGIAKALCNFPSFIRMHHKAGKERDPSLLRSFSDFRTFKLRETEPNAEIGIEDRECTYVLIACYFNPDETFNFGELRFYHDDGVLMPPASIPLEKVSGCLLSDRWSRRELGSPGVDCILLYGREGIDTEMRGM
ncbi:hypothetical protein F5Y01DRAFT_327726 [Xylaria sp. FL0043]|nr:hypothetical protein F5Y01DRAFT_327726 [Xylaria sp. FL0043]